MTPELVIFPFMVSVRMALTSFWIWWFWLIWTVWLKATKVWSIGSAEFKYETLFTPAAMFKASHWLRVLFESDIPYRICYWLNFCKLIVWLRGTTHVGWHMFKRAPMVICRPRLKKRKQYNVIIHFRGSVWDSYWYAGWHIIILIIVSHCPGLSQRSILWVQRLMNRTTTPSREPIEILRRKANNQTCALWCCEKFGYWSR